MILRLVFRRRLRYYPPWITRYTHGIQQWKNPTYRDLKLNNWNLQNFQFSNNLSFAIYFTIEIRLVVSYKKNPSRITVDIVHFFEASAFTVSDSDYGLWIIWITSKVTGNIDQLIQVICFLCSSKKRDAIQFVSHWFECST